MPIRLLRDSIKSIPAVCSGTISLIDTAAAQVVIPYGNFDNDFEKYLVVAVTLATLIFAAWRYFRRK